MSIELQQLERQRIKLYKDYLRQEFQVKNKRSKEEHKEAVQREGQEIKQKVNRFKQEDFNKKLQRRRIASSLNEDNMRFKDLRDSQIYIGSPQEKPNQKPFVSKILQQDIHRYQKLKQTLNFQKNQNQIQQKFRRSQEQRIKEIERVEEARHVERVKQQSQRSIQNYHQILRKHSQDMKAFQRVKQIADLEEQYKISQLRKFQDQEQIFAHVKRNQADIRKKIYKETQQQIKKQIDEFNSRKVIDKSERKVGEQLNKSLLGEMIFRQPKKYAFYLNDLKNQMTQRQFKLSQQNLKRKQKIQVGGIFGGKPTNQRYRQINYVDRKLGLTNQIFSPQKIGNQEDYLHRHEKSATPSKHSEKRDDEVRQKVNRSYQGISTRNQANYSGYNQTPKNIKQEKPNTYHSQSLPKNGQNTHTYSQKQDGKSASQRAYLAYDVITGKHKYYHSQN